MFVYNKVEVNVCDSSSCCQERQRGFKNPTIWCQSQGYKIWWLQGGVQGGANRGIRLSDPHLVQWLYQGYKAFRTSFGSGAQTGVLVSRPLTLSRGSYRGKSLSAPH